ncbi:GNAT family N-acetyltransferase [Streptomyces purpurogeneiscleroticus]|uniref:GNAT family N-acetyltransferase n=1 Tax=Streptomyces purpurogeneiscleroticus TaxID=68259 RepID=UPI001CBC97D2|nr:GNAT family N-acetyltransferase [Streptomyces purpurogeneiscleroticus]MBZ4020471.1 GNAT family N-acetyltransferase [Streptomyces purpurogeneiscleroticus]
MQATTHAPRAADLFHQGLEHRTGAALLRFGAARPRPADRISWTVDGAAAWLDDGRGHVWAVGEPDAAAGLVLRAAQRLPDRVREFTGPRGTETLVARHLAVTDIVEWIFRWTLEEPPVQRGEDRVIVLDESHHDEIRTFLAEHSPAHSTGPGSADVSLWAGIRGTDGRLVACGAMSSLRDSGAPLMASVATDAAQRGQGLGAALTSWLTRHAVRHHGFCTLWQLADNTPADRLYTRLAYRNEDPCVSARLIAH